MSDLLNVLIVEDSEDDTLLILRELRRNGFNIVWERVETAATLQTALHSRMWDVLISDYNLPGFNAPTALKIVQQIQPNLPFIVVSGTVGETSAVELMKAGAHDYLMKENLTRLPEAVRREIREAKIRIERHHSQIILDQTKERLQLALEGSGIGLWDWSIPTGALTLNDRWAEIIGYTLPALEPISIETWRHYIHPEDLQKATLALEQHFCRATQVYECELRMHHRSGMWVWVLARGKVVEWDAAGNPLRMTGTHLDINDRKQAELRLAFQNSILERIAKAEPLLEILDQLARTSEEQLEGALCSILLCDREGKLHYGAAPHLPAAYNQALEDLSIGEGVGSCGTAAFRRAPVIVSDIATDPLWQNYKDLALSYDLRSCWSVPVIASDGSVLATFAVYHRTIHSPQARELEVIALVVNVTKIAIEREYATQALEQLNRELEDRVAQRTAALQQSEASLREAQQVAHLGSWELDVQTRKITWSAEIFRIFGLAPTNPEPSYEELLQYFPPDERVRFNQLIERAIQTGEPYTTDLQIIRADGSSGYIFAKAEITQNAAGQVTRLFGIAMDISEQQAALRERKAIQEALQRSEERARATLLAMPDLVFRVNRDGRYVDFLTSPLVSNLVDPQQVIGKRFHEALLPNISTVHAESQYFALQQVLETQTVQSYEQQIWIEGKVCYEEVRVAPCGNDEVVFFVRDITDRKQSEAQLQQTNEELARATRLKDEFLANMSHELRTPLNAILGMTEGLQEQVFGNINERQLKALQTIESSGTHLLELINDILDVAKIEAGQIELTYTSTSIHHLCQSSLAFIKQQALQKNIQVQVKLPTHLPNLVVDERRTRQVLINLLNNAVKFTPEGGQITLQVQRPTPQDRADSVCWVRFSVTDTGIGITPENIKKLFQPFVQIDSALNRQYTGTGLGLSLVKRIVELHGGRVGVTSDLGVGSCFTIDLPCTPGVLLTPEGTTPNPLALPLEPDFSPIDEVASDAPRILLVEDNVANISTVSDYLEAKGYRILLASDGQAAIDLAKAHQPDLILMDIQMPGMDGLEATRQIRLDPALTEIPIIALTALAMTGDREKCLEAGANDYLTKPVRLKQLANAIQHWTDRKDAQA
ncbi:MAG: response regulator [Scytolyngbya sp. HA4215-MV1]|jgi:PAS domain S-box-containing protein|nr:response regulator [Scytolyngbya sp. HA4215-MV1]